MHIDHLVYAVPDLASAVADLQGRTGVRAATGGKHLGLGTHNALLALGPRTYLEIIAPDPEQLEPVSRRPFGLDITKGARVAGWVVGVEDIDAAIANARAHGYDPGDAIEMQRSTPDGTVLRWRLTLNALDGGPVPLLISWGDTDHPARTAPQGIVLEQLTIEAAAAETLTPTFRALGVDVAVITATETTLVADLRCPHGRIQLR
ncbi:MAG: hypothetical protein QOH79_3116 [Acidimicrobiaceae bacterium]